MLQFYFFKRRPQNSMVTDICHQPQCRCLCYSNLFLLAKIIEYDLFERMSSDDPTGDNIYFYTGQILKFFQLGNLSEIWIHCCLFVCILRPYLCFTRTYFLVNFINVIFVSIQQTFYLLIYC